MNEDQLKLWFDDVNELNYTKEKQRDIKYFTDDEIIEDLQNEFVKYEKVEDYVKNIMSISKAKFEFNKSLIHNSLLILRLLECKS